MNASYRSQSRTTVEVAFFHSIRGKLLLLFLAVALIPLAMTSGVAIIQLNTARATTDEVSKNYLPGIINLDNADIALNHISQAQKNHIVVRDGNLMSSLEAEIRTQQNSLETSLAAIETTLDAAKERETFHELQDALDSFLQLNEEVLNLSRSNRTEEAQALSVGAANTAFEEAHHLLEAIREINVASSEEASQAADIAAQSGFVLTLTITVVAAIAVFVVAFFVAGSIARPVLNVTEVAQKLAVGDVNQAVAAKSRDEIGLMVAAFNQMIAYQQQMAGVAEQLAQGDVTAKVAPQSEKDVLGHAFSRMIAYQQQMAGVAERLAHGDVTANVTPQSEKDILGHTFNQMIAYQQQMAQVAGQLAKGDLTAEVIPQSDKDVLSNAFRQMITNLRDLIGQIIGTANTVGSASQQLATVAEQAGQASQQVASTIQQVAQGTTQQTQGVTEATSNVEQLSRAAEGIARGAQEQAGGVQRTSGLISEMVGIVEQVGQVARSVSEANAQVTQVARYGSGTVGQAGQGMDTIRARTLAAANKVKEMSERSREIGRIVEAIDDIADKTDMLALNAAVEAARAGEHGRGFAVVADQVRKLSEDSKSATRDIGTLIERVQEAVREVIIAMDSTVSEVGNGTRLVSDTVKSLEEILQAAEGAAALAERITNAVTQLRQKSEGVVTAIESVSAVVEENTAVAEEMAASSREVMDAMEGVAGVAEENSASAEEVSASAEEMSAQVEEVVASTQELSLMAEQLRGAVAQFRLGEASSIQAERRTERPRQWPQAAPMLVGRLGNGYDKRAK
jgi:methyl-accepting chemotaxis protein